MKFATLNYAGMSSWRGDEKHEKSNVHSKNERRFRLTQFISRMRYFSNAFLEAEKYTCTLHNNFWNTLYV